MKKQNLTTTYLLIILCFIYIQPLGQILPENIVGQKQLKTNSNNGDLTISYIKRLPEIDYVWNSSNPTKEGWPSVGQQVIWRAYVKNWGNVHRENVEYKWSLDGVLVSTGRIDIPADTEVTVDFEWSWTFDRHIIRFDIDHERRFKEDEEGNNILSIYTDALSIGFYVEQKVYDYFREHQHKLVGAKSNCFENWAQRQIYRWNEMFKSAIYPETPIGVLDRVRIDKIAVVPDGALPLVPIDTSIGSPEAMPNLADRSVDMTWGFTEKYLKYGTFSDHTTVEDYNASYYAGAILHELGHARYLVDVYGFSVFHKIAGGLVEIMEGGEPVAGSIFMLGSEHNYGGTIGLLLYQSNMKGLMATDWTYMDRYSAICMNLIAGSRATSGNYNEPENLGVFLNDLPEENRLTLRNHLNAVLDNATVSIYQADELEGFWYAKKFDNIPDLQFTADDQGRILLGKNPFSKNSKIVHHYEFSNSVIILRVEHKNQVGYTFMDVSQFNMEYWRGNTELGEYEKKIKLFFTTDISLNENVKPSKFEVKQNYPNPFNPSTNIEYSIPSDDNVEIKVFDILGNEITTLLNEYKKAGTYSVNFSSNNLASGIYYYRVTYGNIAKSRKMILVR